MKKITFIYALICVFLLHAALALPASSRQDILQLADKLARQADDLAQSSFDRFRGWKAVFEVPASVIESYPAGNPLQ